MSGVKVLIFHERCKLPTRRGLCFSRLFGFCVRSRAAFPIATAEKVEHTEAASVAEHGTTGQVSRIETRIKESAGLCDCGCETSGCDCGCECCEP